MACNLVVLLSGINAEMVRIFWVSSSRSGYDRMAHLLQAMSSQYLGGRQATAKFAVYRPKSTHASLRIRLLGCASLSPERQGAYHDELRQTAKYISRRGFGILVSSALYT